MNSDSTNTGRIDADAEAEHTPGPWDHMPLAGKHDREVYEDEAGQPVAIVRGNHIPNARLIAAAPDLLEAAIALSSVAEDHFRMLPDDGPEQDYLMSEVIAPARDAIAAATGKWAR